MSKNEFITYCSKLGIEITEELYDEFKLYSDVLKKCNEKINLTAIADEQNIFLKHFYDSLCITKAINLTNVETLCDIGTGAGFPGLVLKLVYPHLKVLLIESNSKKCAFLEFMIKKLKLEDIKVINDRAELYSKENREIFDVVTCRAVASLPVLCEICIPLVKVEGVFLPLKSNVEEELEASKTIINKTGALVREVIKYTLPIEESKRSIVIIDKKIKTNLEYPRDYKRIIRG